MYAFWQVQNTVTQKLSELQSDKSFTKELEVALEQGQKQGQSLEQLNSAVEKIILEKAAAMGISITKEEIASFGSTTDDNELAAASGGVDGCKVGFGVQSGICAVGAFFTAGASAIASAVTSGGTIAASAAAK